MHEQVYLDEIVEIEYVGYEETIDIEVSGNRLFYANDILTHNSGIGNSDLELTDVSESTGLAMTVDFMIGLISTEELAQLGQVMIKQLKNRYSDPDKFKRFVLGVDKTKMRLYDVETAAQKDVVQDMPVFEQTNTGDRLKKSKKDFK